MPDMQQGGEMDVIAACVIGGVSMSGGRGTVPVSYTHLDVYKRQEEW